MDELTFPLSKDQVSPETIRVCNQLKAVKAAKDIMRCKTCTHWYEGPVKIGNENIGRCGIYEEPKQFVFIRTGAEFGCINWEPNSATLQMDSGLGEFI